MIQKIKGNPYFIVSKLKLKEEKLFKINYIFLFIQLLIQSIIYYLFFSSFIDKEAMDFRQVVFYYISINFIFVSMEGAFYFAYEIMMSLQNGVLSTFMVKPFSFVKYKYFEKIGKVILVLIFNLTIISLISLIIFNGINILNTIIAFFVSIFSFTILFFIQGIIGCFTYFFLDITRFRDVIYSILLIFGGKVLPIYLMPKKLISIIKYTPIPYIFDLPANILRNDYTVNALGFQFLWVILLGLIFILMYRFFIYKNIEVFS